MTSRLSISKFQTYADGKVLAYKGDGDLIRDLEDAGPIRVRLDLGGHMDQVILDSVQSNDLHALTRARETLTAVIERLTPLYAADGAPWVGRCMERGEWGCHAGDGHDGPCKLPTESAGSATSFRPQWEPTRCEHASEAPRQTTCRGGSCVCQAGVSGGGRATEPVLPFARARLPAPSQVVGWWLEGATTISGGRAQSRRRRPARPGQPR